jgi:hypothetical protein
MSTTKIVAIVLGIVAVLGVSRSRCLSVAFFGSLFSTNRKHQAADAARTYLRSQRKIEADIGEVKEFGSFVSATSTSGIKMATRLEPEGLRRAQDGERQRRF